MRFYNNRIGLLKAASRKVVNGNEIWNDGSNYYKILDEMYWVVVEIVESFFLNLV